MTAAVAEVIDRASAPDAPALPALRRRPRRLGSGADRAARRVSSRRVRPGDRGVPPPGRRRVRRCPALRRLRDRAPLRLPRGRADLRAARAEPGRDAGVLPVRARLRDGDRDHRRRRPRRASRCASSSSTSSTARPAGASAASSTAPASCATSARLSAEAQRIACARRDPRDRPGDDRLDLPGLRRRRPDRRPQLQRVPAALPASRAGSSTTRARSGTHPARRRRGARGRRDPGRRARRDRDHEPARDRRRVGSRDRRAGPQRARLAGPAHGRPLRRAPRGRATRTWSASAPAWCSTRTSRGPRSSGSCRTSEAVRERRGLRHDRLLARLQAHRPARDRPARTPRARSCSTSASGGGMPSCASSSASTPPGCPRRCPRRTSTARPRSSAARCRSRGSPATSRRRCSGRHATRRARARTPTGPAASSSSTPGPRRPPAKEGLLTTIAWGIGDEVDYALEAAIFVTGRRGAVASRRARRDRRRGRDRGPCRVARLERRRLLRAGADRPRLAALGSVRARDDRRAHARAAARRTWPAPPWRRSPTRRSTRCAPRRPPPGRRCHELRPTAAPSRTPG